MSWPDLTSAMHQIVLDTYGATVSYRHPPYAAFDVAMVAEPQAKLTEDDPSRVFGARLSDFTAYQPTAGDTLTFGGVEYDVHAVEPDNRGWVCVRARAVNT